MAVSQRALNKIMNEIGRQLPLSARAKRLLKLVAEIAIYEFPGGSRLRPRDFRAIAESKLFRSMILDLHSREIQLDFNRSELVGARTIFHLFSNSKAVRNLIYSDGAFPPTFGAILDKD